MKLSAEAREARRKYDREYYAAHKEQARKRNERYWERKAAEAAKKADTDKEEAE